uniref:Capsid protein n=1 Tax=Wenling banjofish astrovirus TaxID=2116415 RepID=A0A2P1GMV0_9VIRU|nr:capsid protein [Wenling banjofish astrovirus]
MEKTKRSNAMRPKSTKSATKSGSSRRRRPSRPKSEKDRSQDAQIKELKETVLGTIKRQETVTGTIYIGDINASDTQEWLSQALVPSNPALLGRKGGKNNPLLVKATQYAKYRIMRFQLKLVPLVPHESVMGATVCVSANHASGEVAGPIDYNQFLQRDHVEALLGQKVTFSPRFMKKWFAVDTATGPSQATQPGFVIVSTLGQAQSVYTKEKIATALWRVHVEYTYQFGNYQDNSGMKNLLDEKPSSAVLQTGDNNEVVMGFPKQQMSRTLIRAAQEQSRAAKVIWTLADVTATTLSTLFPEASPFLACGLWVLKAIFGGNQRHSRLSQDYQWFTVHENIDTAREDVPLVNPTAVEQHHPLDVNKGVADLAQFDTPLAIGGEIQERIITPSLPLRPEDLANGRWWPHNSSTPVERPGWVVNSILPGGYDMQGLQYQLSNADLPGGQTNAMAVKKQNGQWETQGSQIQYHRYNMVSSATFFVQVYFHPDGTTTVINICTSKQMNDLIKEFRNADYVEREPPRYLYFGSNAQRTSDTSPIAKNIKQMMITNTQGDFPGVYIRGSLPAAPLVWFEKIEDPFSTEYPAPGRGQPNHPFVMPEDGAPSSDELDGKFRAMLKLTPASCLIAVEHEFSDDDDSDTTSGSTTSTTESSDSE